MEFQLRMRCELTLAYSYVIVSPILADSRDCKSNSACRPSAAVRKTVCEHSRQEDTGETCSCGSSIWRELANEVMRGCGDVGGQSGHSAVQLISI